MNKDLNSNANSWAENITINLLAASETNRAFSTFQEGFEALVRARNVIDSHPKVSPLPSLHLTLTRDDLDDAWQHASMLTNFADGIHYEVAGLVDVPFVTGVAPVHQAAVDLDPGDFKTDDKFLWIFPAGKSLKDLVLSTIDNKELKNSFKEQVKKLDKDKVSKTLKQTLEDAKFWETEIAYAQEVRAVTQIYIDTYEKQWDNLSMDEKKAAMQTLANDISAVYGIKPPKFDWYSKRLGAYPEAHQLGLSTGGNIYVNDRYGDGSAVNFNFLGVTNTIVHETRHEVQYDLKGWFGRAPKNVKDDWSKTYIRNPYIDYYTQPVEMDARALAGFVC